MQELIIEAGKSEAHYWRDLWRYRELFGFLAWRDILVRYKQTVIGVAWAVIRPLLTNRPCSSCRARLEPPLESRVPFSDPDRSRLDAEGARTSRRAPAFAQTDAATASLAA